LEAVAEHYALYLGEAENDAPVDGVRILNFQPDEEEFVTFASLGLSTAPITAVYPQEIVCSVVDGQDGAAGHLVRIAVELALRQGRGLINEDVIPNDGPLLQDTQIHGVLVASHPALGDSFNVVFGPDRESVTAELMTLIPLTDKEIALANREGVQSLIALLDVADVDLLDVTRESAVSACRLTSAAGCRGDPVWTSVCRCSTWDGHRLMIVRFLARTRRSRRWPWPRFWTI
jgi:hypothetical protein